MRAVNTENEKILKNYQSEGRILKELPIQTEFMSIALKTGIAHKNLYMDSLWAPENYQRVSNSNTNSSNGEDMLFNSGN
jgi:hypothetical protein